MTKLSEESNQLRHLSRFNAEVMEALRRIRDNPNLSLEQIRMAIDDILLMVRPNTHHTHLTQSPS